MDLNSIEDFNHDFTFNAASPPGARGKLMGVDMLLLDSKISICLFITRVVIPFCSQRLGSITMVVAGINMDGGVPVIGMEYRTISGVAVLLVIIEKVKMNLSDVVRTWRLMGEKAIGQPRVIVPSNVNPNLVAARVVPKRETMRVMYDPWVANNKVDVFFSSQVHAYERSTPVVNVISRPLKDQSAPVYITIADGGNIEGFAPNFRYDFCRMTEPQPKYSATEKQALDML
ncbi:LOW QUALITY PROTEIN: hypothetical protein HID58_049073 [Brassica napus]|uniref:Uncharacterized protein n=1 Tax=Brassica napus TaxID=3708 RepID=A0ABQ8B3X9_BRANA|nr:LOW QUALITY PROTEIN: hypothetical protein HID58_049073 [Brassica napus]